MWRAQNILVIGDCWFKPRSRFYVCSYFVNVFHLFDPFVTINIMISIELLKFVNTRGDTPLYHSGLQTKEARILLCLRFSIPFVAPNLNWKKPSQYVLVKYKAKNFKKFLIGTNYMFFSPTMKNFEFQNLEVVFKIDYKKKINF